MGSALGPFDPSILGRVPLRPIRNPVEQYMSLRDMMMSQQIRSQQMQAQRLELEQRQREAEEYSAFKDVLRRGGTVQEAIQASPNYGIKYATEERQRAKAAADAEVSDIQRNRERLTEHANALAALLQEPDPEKRAALNQQINNDFVRRGWITQEQADAHGPTDENAFWQAYARAKGMLGVQELRDKIDAAKRAKETADFEAKKRGPELSKLENEALTAGANAAGRTVETVTDQASYDRWRQGLDKRIQDMIPTQYSPAAVKIVTRMGMSSSEAQMADYRQQELDRQREKDRREADPLGLGLTAGAGTGGATPATAAGGIQGASPFAREIANFEGFNKPGSVAQRNNNPGNLRGGPGATGTDAQGYAIFPDVQTGLAALEDLIKRRAAQGLTVQEFFGGKPGTYAGYAPAGDKNNPQQYADTVSKNLGVDSKALVSSIVGGAPAAPQASASATGEQFLATLPPAVATRVKAIAEGRDKPTGSEQEIRQWHTLVGRYDPNYDLRKPDEKALSGEAAKVKSIAETMIPEAQLLQQKIKAGGRVAILGILTKTDTELSRLAEDVGDKIGRIRSGGAINKDEQSRFMGQIARWGDLWSGSGDAVSGLDRYIEEARNIATSMDPKHKGPPPAQTPAAVAAPTAPQKPATPPIGTVVRGYKFLGGDPAKRESWQKVS